MERARTAVVGLQVQAVEGAHSATTPGRERQGSGVLITDDGVVLTIGYLVLEAESVELVTETGRHVPARVLAYDQASGFGLVQALWADTRSGRAVEPEIERGGRPMNITVQAVDREMTLRRATGI